MQSLTNTKKLTVEEFLTLPSGDVTYELVEGKAVPKDKPMSPQRFLYRNACCGFWMGGAEGREMFIQN